MCADLVLERPADSEQMLSNDYRDALPIRVHEPETIDLPQVLRLNPVTFKPRLKKSREQCSGSRRALRLFALVSHRLLNTSGLLTLGESDARSHARRPPSRRRD